MVVFTLTPSTRHQRLALAITGQQHDPGSHRLVGRDQRQLLAVADDPPAFGGWRPARQSKSCGWPLPSAPAIPTISPLSQREADRPERLPLEAVDHEHLAGLAHLGGGRREGSLERAADDQLDELRLGRGLRVERALVPAVAKDRDAVGDLEHLRQAMAHVHHADAATPAGGDGPMQRLHLVRSQGGGRLVEQQHLRVGDERLGHLEELAVGQGEGPRRGVREQLEVEVELGQELPRPLLPPPERRSLVLGRRQVEVVLHRLGQDQRGVLVGHRQAQLPGQRRGIPAKGFAPDPDRAQIGVDEPAGDPEEGRLPRAVLADDGVDLTGTAVEADIGQRSNRPELPGHTAQLEDQVAGGRPSSWIAFRHQLANISCRTASGTSEVPDTAGATRSGSQSAAVTCRITCGTTTSAGIVGALERHHRRGDADP